MAWNRSDSEGTSPEHARKRQSSANGSRKGFSAAAVSVLLIVIFGGVIAWYLFDNENGDQTPQTKVQPVAKAVPTKPGNHSTTTVIEKVAVSEVKSKEPEKWYGVEIAQRTVKTNGTMVIERIRTVDGKTHAYFHDDAPPVFETAADQILALATCDDPLAPPLPMGGGFEESFAKALKKEIIINDDDSDDVKEVKQRVIQARKDMAAMMAQGMSANEVLKQNEELRKHNYESREIAVQGLMEYLEKGDLEGAQNYCDTMNQALDSMGIMRIEIPEKRERRKKQ